MELFESVIETIAAKDLPWDESYIMPVGDIQLGDESCDEDRFKRHLDWGMRHGAYFVGMGDYIDITSPYGRAKLRAASFYDSMEDALEEIVQQKVERFLSLVKGTENRWLGILEGHHYYEFSDGTTTDIRIAQAVNTVFLGNCAFVRLRFINGNKVGITATLWVHHGAGGGVTAGAPLNKLERIVAAFDADIYLIGHQHKKVASPIDHLYMTGKPPYHIKHKTKVIACTGGFLQGYKEGLRRRGRAQGTYVEKAMMPPVALGGILLKIRPVHTEEGNRLDINVEL